MDDAMAVEILKARENLLSVAHSKTKLQRSKAREDRRNITTIAHLHQNVQLIVTQARAFVLNNVDVPKFAKRSHLLDSRARALATTERVFQTCHELACRFINGHHKLECGSRPIQRVWGINPII